jgi:hypothetical protein
MSWPTWQQAPAWRWRFPAWKRTKRGPHQSTTKRIEKSGIKWWAIPTDSPETLFFHQHNNNLPMRAAAHEPIGFADASFGHRFL